MKKIHVIMAALLSLAFVSCTKLNLDDSVNMGYDMGLGLPVCKVHASVFDILSKNDTAGYVYMNPLDQSLHVYWTGETQKIEFDFMRFNKGGKSSSSFKLKETAALKPILDFVPEGMYIPLPEGHYVCRDTLHYNFEFDSYTEGKKDCAVDSISINKASIDIVLDVEGLTVDDNNYIDLNLYLPTIKGCSKNTFKVRITNNKMNISRVISQFVADFSDQMYGMNVIDIIFEYEIVSDGSASINKEAGINYTTQFNLIDYNTAFGRYWQEDAIYSDMIGIKMPAALRDAALLKDNKLYFHNPEVALTVRHNVGADIKYVLDYVRTLDKDGNPLKYADFGGSRQYKDDLKRPNKPHDVACDTLLFNRYNGATNELFTVIPDSMEMKCNVFVGEENGAHTDFLVNPVGMLVDVEAHMELSFDPGTSFTMKDTAKADLAGATGVTNYVEVSELWVLLDCQNSLPVGVTVDVAFMDSAHVEFYHRDDIKLECPEVDAKGVAIAPTGQSLELCFTGEDIKKVLQTKYVCFTITVAGHDAESMIAIHADNAVDLSLSAYAKARANMGGILK